MPKPIGWVLPVVWVGIIFYLCTKHTGGTPPFWLHYTNADKIVHAAMHGINVCLWCWFAPKPLNLKFAISTVIYTSLYGILIEVLQWSVFTYRTASIQDVLANTIGAVFAFMLVLTTTNETVPKH